MKWPLLVLLMASCQPARNITTEREFTHKTAWNHEKGIVTTPKASMKVHWE